MFAQQNERGRPNGLCVGVSGLASLSLPFSRLNTSKCTGAQRSADSDLQGERFPGRAAQPSRALLSKHPGAVSAPGPGWRATGRGTEDAQPCCLEKFITESQSRRWQADTILTLGPEGHCQHRRAWGSVTKDAERKPSGRRRLGVKTESPAVSFEASVLNHLQVLLVEPLLSFQKLLQLLGLPFAQLFALAVMCGQTLGTEGTGGHLHAPDSRSRAHRLALGRAWAGTRHGAPTPVTERPVWGRPPPAQGRGPLFPLEAAWLSPDGTGPSVRTSKEDPRV